MILWREKFRAFAIHFVATLVVALIAAALIFFVWYPPPFDTMVGGLKLFLLVAGCDLALGPLISLVIYNSRKSRRELTLDYLIVGVVQVAAFVYGVYAVSQARPVYIVFAQDRLEVIAAGEILESERAQARDPKYAGLSHSGPVLVATHVKPEERNDALFAALEGRDISVRPKFYVDYQTQLDAIRARTQPLEKLEQKHPESKPFLDTGLKELRREARDFGWLPVKHTRGFWTALIDLKSSEPVHYIPIDPY
ncbi:MAG TPA: TfpX/TfpZ family type IV pilin accessory protein [Steroidobacteraceae bacterium]|nr:TfpX/TfpZ family type IV pilin accessory protein [Steroidobacteraceae bacterium]